MNHSRQLRGDILRLAFLMGLCSAIGIYLILTTVLITKDGVFYLEQARQFALDPGRVCRRYPPGYPFLIWASHELASRFVQGDSPALWAYSAQGVTLLCRVLALIPLYGLGRLLVGTANSFWALFVLVILPYPAFYGSDVLREWPYLLFLSLGLLLLYRALTTRRWRLLAPVGLIAGLGYLIRPECAQLIVYALLGLIVAWDSPRVERETQYGTRTARRIGAGLLLIAGFVVPTAPYVYASGSLIPHQLRPSALNLPPVISAVGPRAAANDPLEFEVCEGSLLELPIRASDPDGDELAFALVGVPVGSRPVYEFRLAAAGTLFWTLSEQERERLITVYPEMWNYEGIAWYAYARADAGPGLRTVYRFWSPARQRHFYTMSEAEKEAILTESAPEQWTYEGAVFHTFAEEDHPADARAVCRFWNEEAGYTWDEPPSAEVGAKKDVVAWYAHPAGEPPAGAVIEGGTFRWRPGAGRQGEYQVNIIVTDGKLVCCQLVVIRVVGAASVRRIQPTRGTATNAHYSAASVVPPSGGRLERDRWGLSLAVGRSDLGKLAVGVRSMVGAIGDDFMFIPVLPWILGLWCCLRDRTRGGLERVLIPAVLIVNVSLMLGRSMWIETGSDRRYSLAMIALTIFYLPAGLDVMTRVMNRVYTFRGRLAAFGSERRPPWFYLLMVGGVVLCTPKLLFSPLRGDKAGLRAAGEWLRHNTPAEAVIAIPDNRVGFYADRQGLFYERYPNWRKADCVVEVTKNDSTLKPEGWKQVYSVPLGPKDKRMVTIYVAAQTKE